MRQALCKSEVLAYESVNLQKVKVICAMSRNQHLNSQLRAVPTQTVIQVTGIYHLGTQN
jgi:hypothetical protein